MHKESSFTGARLVTIIAVARAYIHIARGAAIVASEKAAAVVRHDDFGRPPPP